MQASEVQGWEERVRKHRNTARAHSAFQDKTFSQLSPEEKDSLLRVVAERLGLIKSES
jgi:hypothetical protein